MAARSVPLETLANLRLEQSNLKLGLVARNTASAYASDWHTFEAFCARFGLAALPASEETVALFLTDQLRGHKISTARRRKWAIAAQHKTRGLASPITPAVNQLLRGAQRIRAEKPRQMLPITVRELRLMSAALARSGSPVDMRNRAILVVGFVSALRRSNLAALNLADVEFVPQGLILSVGREKNDQEGIGRLVGLPRGHNANTDASRVLRDWLRLRGRKPGPLFPRLDPPHEGEVLSGESICRVVKKSLMSVEISPVQRGAHSMRSGLISAAAEANISALRISKFTGQSPEIVQNYFRRSELWRGNVAGKVGL